MEKVIVTRHPALVEYLFEMGLVPDDVKVLEHATADDVRGKHVFGVLPLHLAAEAELVTEVPLTLTPVLRGKELPVGRLKEVAGSPVTYKVIKVEVTKI